MVAMLNLTALNGWKVSEDPVLTFEEDTPLLLNFLSSLISRPNELDLQIFVGRE